MYLQEWNTTDGVKASESPSGALFVAWIVSHPLTAVLLEVWLCMRDPQDCSTLSRTEASYKGYYSVSES